VRHHEHVTDPNQPRLLTADILYTGMGVPVRDGGVLVSGEVIAATGPAAELRAAYPHAREERAGRVIAPPPVNAHTHLDMSLYPFRALPYFRWIPEVVIANRHLRGADGARHGLAAVRLSGAAAVGDIVWDPDVMTYLLQESDVPGVAYWEVLDPNPATAHDTLARTVERVRTWRKLERPGGMRVGLSSHATYTVSARLHQLLARFASEEGLPMQIHVAEHASETELLQAGTGPLADALAKFDWPFTLADVLGRAPGPDLTPVRHLADLGVLDARPTLVHVVHATVDDARMIAQAGCSVITCPRSNRNLECGTFDWPLFAREGVDVAIGTDSVASGESLDIHDEIRAAWRIHSNLDQRAVVRAAVKGGTRVTGGTVPFIRRGADWSGHYVWPDPHGGTHPTT